MIIPKIQACILKGPRSRALKLENPVDFSQPVIAEKVAAQSHFARFRPEKSIPVTLANGQVSHAGGMGEFQPFDQKLAKRLEVAAQVQGAFTAALNMTREMEQRELFKPFR